MMRIFICPNCGKTRAISKFLRAECFDCEIDMVMCRLPYIRWVDLTLEEREKVVEEYINDNKKNP